MKQVTASNVSRETLTREPTEASDVQDPDEVGRGVKGEALVDPGDHVVEQAAVHGLCQGITGVIGLLHFEGHSDKDTGRKERWRTGD